MSNTRCVEERLPLPVLRTVPKFPLCSGISDATMVRWSREYIRERMVKADDADAGVMFYRTANAWMLKPAQQEFSV